MTYYNPLPYCALGAANPDTARVLGDFILEGGDIGLGAMPLGFNDRLRQVADRYDAIVVDTFGTLGAGTSSGARTASTRTVTATVRSRTCSRRPTRADASGGRLQLDGVVALASVPTIPRPAPHAHTTSARHARYYVVTPLASAHDRLDQRNARRRQDDRQRSGAGAAPGRPRARRREGRRDAHGHHARPAGDGQLPALAAVAAARRRDRPPRPRLHRRHPGDADDRARRAVLAGDQRRPRRARHPRAALRPPRRPGHPPRTDRGRRGHGPVGVPAPVRRALRRGGPHVAARRGRGRRHHRTSHRSRRPGGSSSPSADGGPARCRSRPPTSAG